MESIITQGIRVSVETFYQEKHSNPEEDRYVYAYRIQIRNESADTVQLLRRHWYIRDSNNILREVEGEGVIGQQPVIEPGAHHEYVSWTNLLTDIGKMYGVFTVRKEENETLIDVQIPEFTMVAPFRLN